MFVDFNQDVLNVIHFFDTEKEFYQRKLRQIPIEKQEALAKIHQECFRLNGRHIYDNIFSNCCMSCGFKDGV